MLALTALVVTFMASSSCADSVLWRALIAKATRLRTDARTPNLLLGATGEVHNAGFCCHSRRKVLLCEMRCVYKCKCVLVLLAAIAIVDLP